MILHIDAAAPIPAYADSVVLGSCPPFLVSRDTHCSECNSVHDFEQCPKCFSWIWFIWGLMGGGFGLYMGCSNPTCDWSRKTCLGGRNMTSSYDFSFRNPNNPHMARGDYMLGGVAVVVSPLVPREHYADEVVYVPERWLTRLARRLFGSPQRPRVIAGAKMEREQAYMAGDKLFISPEGWEEIKAQSAA